jgi:hypothetical protein
MNPEDQHRSCPGFLDEYGIWNNGFECPSISNQIHVCCGTDSSRYCCTINSSEKSFLLLNKTTLSFLKNLNLTFLTLPIQLTCILIIILLLLLILIILFICYRYHKQKNDLLDQKNYSTNQTLIVDHFPFSPPHHKLFFNKNNQHIKGTLTTSTSSARIPSNIYLNNSKEFFHKTEKSMNIHPITSNNYQQDDIIV